MSYNQTLLDVIVSGHPIYIKKDWSLSLCNDEEYRYELKVNDITLSEAHAILKLLMTLKDSSSRDRFRVQIHLMLQYKLKWELSPEIKGRIEQEEIEDRKVHPERWICLDGRWRRTDRLKID